MYDQTKTQLDNLSESAKFLETNTFVRAQFSGVIAAKNYEDGELYSGAPILSLQQISMLKAIINIPEAYYPLVKKGMKVEVRSDIYKDEVFPATIEIVYPTIDPASHTFQTFFGVHYHLFSEHVGIIFPQFVAEMLVYVENYVSLLFDIVNQDKEIVEILGSVQLLCQNFVGLNDVFHTFV